MAAKKSKPDRSKKSGKARKAKKGAREGAAGETTMLSVAGDPRAAAFVRKAKGWCGLGGFILAFYLSMSASVPFPTSAGRAVIAGFAGYLVGWGCSVTIWRQLMLAEVRAAYYEAQPASSRRRCSRTRRSNAATPVPPLCTGPLPPRWNVPSMTDLIHPIGPVGSQSPYVGRALGTRPVSRDDPATGKTGPSGGGPEREPDDDPRTERDEDRGPGPHIDISA